jgi:hypothetical protein
MEELGNMLDMGWQVGFLTEAEDRGDGWYPCVWWRGKYKGVEYEGKRMTYGREAVRDFMDFAGKLMNGSSTDVVIE